MGTLTAGDPVPWFTGQTRTNPAYRFHSVAGRCIVLCCFGSLAVPPAQRILATFRSRRPLFDDISAAFFGVGIDPRDLSSEATEDAIPGVRFLWDFQHEAFKALDLIANEAGLGARELSIRPATFVLDRRLRVVRAFSFANPETHVDDVLACLKATIEDDRSASVAGPAPVLVLPRVFEPDFCRALIGVYNAIGGKDSGYMVEVDGRTTLKNDPAHKLRRDCNIEDERLRDAIQARIRRRLLPEIEKAFQFRATRMERYIVACYDAESGGHFKPHRDNTTRGTAHRKFAVTMNLNTDEYEGGDLRFPEFGGQTYRAPTGGAVVFSCSLMHEAMPVTRGRRFAFLPFLYDDAGAQVRERNNAYLAESVKPYENTLPPDRAVKE